MSDVPVHALVGVVELDHLEARSLHSGDDLLRGGQGRQPVADFNALLLRSSHRHAKAACHVSQV